MFYKIKIVLLPNNFDCVYDRIVQLVMITFDGHIHQKGITGSRRIIWTNNRIVCIHVGRLNDLCAIQMCSNER